MIPAGSSSRDPYVIRESLPQASNGIGYSNPNGRTQVSSVIIDRPNTQIIIVDGQSEHGTNNGTAPYTTVSANAQNFSPYDGGVYQGQDPVLGAGYSALGPSSMIMRIADRVISQGHATRVIMCPIAVNGSHWSYVVPGASGDLFSRFRAAYLRLAAMGQQPDKILAARGVADNDDGTSAASVTASITAWAQGIRDLGCTSPIYIGKFTMSNGAIGSAVRTGIDNAISVPLDIRAGYDADTALTIAGGYRLPDGTHLSDTGLTAGANGWVSAAYL